MRRRYVLALVLGTGLIFVAIGLVVGYALWHSDSANAAVVTNRTAERNANGTVQLCVNYSVVGDGQERCWAVTLDANNHFDPPDCWNDSKIGATLPESCR